MRALVTGISGFVGGHLAEHLADAGDEVVGLSRSGRPPGGVAAPIRVEAVDLARAAESDLAALIARERPGAIYHLAAQANPQASVADPRGTWDLNLGGALTLLEAAKASGVKPRIVLVGSGVSYGNPPPDRMPVDESCPLRPNNPYSSSKAAADLLGVQHFLAHGTDAVMVRPFNHAGPRQSSTYVLAGLARQVAEVEAGIKPEVLVGNLDIVRDFTDVRDVAAGYRLLALRGEPGEIYNLGTGRGVRLSDALATLQSLARTPIPARVDPARVRPVDQPLLVADATKLRLATGWQPRRPIERTLADMLEGWRAAIAAGPPA